MSRKSTGEDLPSDLSEPAKVQRAGVPGRFLFPRRPDGLPWRVVAGRGGPVSGSNSLAGTRGPHPTAARRRSGRRGGRARAGRGKGRETDQNSTRTPPVKLWEVTPRRPSTVS